mmetsp:Transcript_96810/g.279488  ORF Transcript_96810/g.279488 Transcript_96810/m.279488 type:complete len:213 (-) Transcript_96810:19-657(-)
MEKEDPLLSATCSTKDLCSFCFQVLLARLQGRSDPSLEGLEALAKFKVPGIFVSWSNSDSKLRGCMGTLRPIWLDHGLAHFALKSALDDRRFRPVELEEVPRLTCRVSILHDFEPCEDAYDWELGVHGVRIIFATTRFLCPCSSTFYSAAYLPDVMVEHSLDRESAIRQLVRKSGYAGRCDSSLIEAVEATRFRARVDELSYAEFADQVREG